MTINKNSIKRCAFVSDSSRPSCNNTCFTIVATACVVPPVGVPGLIRSDPVDRLTDYINTLRKWLKTDDRRIGNIVILENSGYPPQELLDLILRDLIWDGDRSVEVISYVAPARPYGLHYGYSEFQMIDDLIDYSEFRSEFFIKVTGRYYYSKISKLIDAVGSDFTFVFDSISRPSIPFFLNNPAKSASVGIFLCRREYFNKFIRSLYVMMCNKPRFTHIEDIIFDKFIVTHGSDGVLCRFPVNCDPEGFGGNGDNLKSGSKRMKSIVRALFRRVFPNVWI
jgi:hypothetical protein